MTLPAEWMPGMKRLPKHTLCTHVMVNGKRVCLAVPTKDAPAELRAIERLRKHMRLVSAAYAKKHPRLLPKNGSTSRAAPRTERFWRKGSKLHRHTTRCIRPLQRHGVDQLGWFQCTKVPLHVYANGEYLLHEHRTKRGRRFLVNHRDFCPVTAEALIAR